MTRIYNIGNMPKFMSVFLTHKMFKEVKNLEVYDCSYNEIINRAKDEKLEPQVLIDKKESKRAYLCAVGASLRKNDFDLTTAPPVFYYAELDEPRRKQFIKELDAARKEVINKKREQLKKSKELKEKTRESSKKLNLKEIESEQRKSHKR